MKKILGLWVIILTVAILMSGCSTPGPTPTQTAASPVAPTASAIAPTSSLPPTPSIAPTKLSATVQPIATPVSAASPRAGGTLNWIESTSPGAPIGVPWEANGSSAAYMQYSEQFLLKEETDGSIVSNLASSYEINSSAASPSITFHLPKGVKFSDGTDCNAQAIKWNLEQEMSKSSTNYASTLSWKSIDVVDDYTLRVNMLAWQNILLNTFANSPAFIVSPAAYTKNGIDWMRWNTVGTGAFLQSDFQRDVKLNFARNPNYWEQGKPYLNQLQILFVSDAMTAEALFRSGGADVIRCSTTLQAVRLQSDFKILTQTTGAMETTLIPDSKNTDSPWSNLKVRQAAEYALDKEALAKAFGFGYVQPAYQYCTPDSKAFDAKLTPRTYNTARAKQLMTEAGYPNGFKTTIIAAPMGLDTNLVNAVQAYLSAVGIQCSIQYPQAAAWSQYISGTWKNGVLMGRILMYANPNTGFNGFGVHGSMFLSLKKPDGFDDLLNASLSTPDLDPSALQKCEGALYNDVTEIPINYSESEWAVTDRVQDSGIGSRGTWTWWEPQNVWLSK